MAVGSILGRFLLKAYPFFLFWLRGLMGTFTSDVPFFLYTLFLLIFPFFLTLIVNLTGSEMQSVSEGPNHLDFTDGTTQDLLDQLEVLCFDLNTSSVCLPLPFL